MYVGLEVPLVYIKLKKKKKSVRGNAQNFVLTVVVFETFWNESISPAQDD